MEKIHLIILLAELVISSWCNTFTTEPASVTKTFVPSQTLFPNPERGWTVHLYSHNMRGLDNLRNSTEKVSLVLVKVDISGYVNSAQVHILDRPNLMKFAQRSITVVHED